MRIVTHQGDLQLSKSHGDRLVRRLAALWPLPVVVHEGESGQYSIGFQRGHDVVKVMEFALAPVSFGGLEDTLDRILAATRQVVIERAGKFNAALLVPMPFLREGSDGSVTVGVALYVTDSSGRLLGSDDAQLRAVCQSFVQAFSTSEQGAMLAGFTGQRCVDATAVGVLKLELAIVEGEPLLLALTDPDGLFPPDVMDCLAAFAARGSRQLAWAPSAASVLGASVESISVDVECERAALEEQPLDASSTGSQGTAEPLTEQDAAVHWRSSEGQAGEHPVIVQPSRQGVPLSTLESLPRAGHAPRTTRDSQPLPSGRPTRPLFTIPANLDEDQSAPPLVAVVGADVAVLGAEGAAVASTSTTAASVIEEGGAVHHAASQPTVDTEVTADAPEAPRTPEVAAGYDGGAPALDSAIHDQGSPRELPEEEGDASASETDVVDEQYDSQDGVQESGEANLRRSLAALVANPLGRLARIDWDQSVAQLVAAAMDTCGRGHRWDLVPEVLRGREESAQVMDGVSGLQLLVRGEATTGVKVCVGSGFSSDELERSAALVGPGCERLVVVTLVEREPPSGWRSVSLAELDALWTEAARLSSTPQVFQAAAELCRDLVGVHGFVHSVPSDVRRACREAIREAGLLAVVRRQVALECLEELEARLAALWSPSTRDRAARMGSLTLDLSGSGDVVELHTRVELPWGSWGVRWGKRSVSLYLDTDESDSQQLWFGLLESLRLPVDGVEGAGGAHARRLLPLDLLSSEQVDAALERTTELLEAGLRQQVVRHG